MRPLKDAYLCSAVSETLGMRVIEGRECGGARMRGREGGGEKIWREDNVRERKGRKKREGKKGQERKKWKGNK